MLARFNEIIPDGAHRIVAMAESQQRHRQDLESAVVHGNVNAQNRGQWFGFIVAMTAVLGGLGLIAFDKSTEGLATIITAIAGLAGVFVYGRYVQHKERADKRRELEDAARQPRLPLGE
jgi:uncharacterized membrane protein